MIGDDVDAEINARATLLFEGVLKIYGALSAGAETEEDHSIRLLAFLWALEAFVIEATQGERRSRRRELVQELADLFVDHVADYDAEEKLH